MTLKQKEKNLKVRINLGENRKLVFDGIFLYDRPEVVVFNHQLEIEQTLEGYMMNDVQVNTMEGDGAMLLTHSEDGLTGLYQVSQNKWVILAIYQSLDTSSDGFYVAYDDDERMEFDSSGQLLYKDQIESARERVGEYLWKVDSNAGKAFIYSLGQDDKPIKEIDTTQYGTVSHSYSSLDYYILVFADQFVLFNSKGDELFREEDIPLDMQQEIKSTAKNSASMEFQAITSHGSWLAINYYGQPLTKPTSSVPISMRIAVILRWGMVQIQSSLMVCFILRCRWQMQCLQR